MSKWTKKSFCLFVSGQLNTISFPKKKKYLRNILRANELFIAMSVFLSVIHNKAAHIYLVEYVYYFLGCDFYHVGWYIWVLTSMWIQSNRKWRGFALILHFPILKRIQCTHSLSLCIWSLLFTCHKGDYISFSTLHVLTFRRSTQKPAR